MTEIPVSYTVKDVLVYREEDVFEDGCQPGTGYDSYIGYAFRGDTKEKAIDSFKEFFDFDEVELDVCDEIGRIEGQRLECDDGTELTDREIALWQEGKLKAWCATYTGFLYEVRPVKAGD